MLNVIRTTTVRSVSRPCSYSTTIFTHPSIWSFAFWLLELNHYYFGWMPPSFFGYNTYCFLLEFTYLRILYAFSDLPYILLFIFNVSLPSAFCLPFITSEKCILCSQIFSSIIFLLLGLSLIFVVKYVF